METKIKAELRIILDEAGGIGVTSSTANLVTIFGMLEIAKKAYIEQSLKRGNLIEVPRMTLP